MPKIRRETGSKSGVSTALPIQPNLDHRGGLKTAPLFPPAGTFEAIGGRAAVSKIVDGLYNGIEADSLLRPAFGRDLTLEREKVKLFFEAWFGGESTYFDTHWNPGLKGRHEGISISRNMASHWARHFLHAFTAVVKDPTLIDQIKPIIARLTMALVNRSDEPGPGEKLRCSTYNVDFQALYHQPDDTAQSQLIRQQGSRLLLIAAVRGKTQAAEELLRQGVNVNMPMILSGSDAIFPESTLLHITPLCAALAKRRDSIVKLLIEHGAQYDIFTAASLGDVDAVRELLDLNPSLADVADPAADVAQITPLLHAAVAGQFEVAQILFQNGAKVGLNSARLIRAAANQGHEALTDLLLEYGADPALIGAGAWVLYPAIADKLLARGADVNQPPGLWIGLCCTGNSGHKENALLARSLLRYGADVNADYKGRSALHCAAKAGFVQVAEALIEYGGDVNAHNDRGQTPLDELENAGKSIDREPIRRLLIAHGARRA